MATGLYVTPDGKIMVAYGARQIPPRSDTLTLRPADNDVCATSPSGLRCLSPQLPRPL